MRLASPALAMIIVALALQSGSCASNTTNKEKGLAVADNSAQISDMSHSVDGLALYNPAAKLNHLVGESSPYLLSHADNPVDWYPWGEEALEKSRAEDKPIFLSIGYAACHWCHVMEHESFEDSTIAAFLNEHYISIKVDREQRPDLDQIYMTAVQTFTRGGGGWPMSVFLTPDLKPFFAGTYFPPTDNPSYGRPGFLSVLKNINKVYQENRDQLNQQAEELAQAVRQKLAPLTQRADLGLEIFERAISQSLGNVDYTYGGFGGSRKFPHSEELKAILRHYALTADEKARRALQITLWGMISAGLYDQVGGGFHRYTVDQKWVAPHFEKMLYDNSLLVPLYLDAYLVFSNGNYLRTAIETLDFMRRELTDSEGGLYAALDADSEGEEGIFYIWRKTDLDLALGDDADFYYQYYIAADAGNFEHGQNVLARHKQAFASLLVDPDSSAIQARLDRLNRRLLEKRAERVRPLTDDKIVTGWNGMALTAFARGYQVTGEIRFLEAAQKLARFLHGKMYREHKLLHTYRHGVYSSGLFLEDYAYVANGMVDLYESDFDSRWLSFARELATSAFTLFSDSAGYLFLSPEGVDDHLVRPSDIYDGSYPSPGGKLLQAAQRVAAFYDDKDLEFALQKSLNALSGAISRAPVGMMSTLLASHNQFLPRAEFAIVGEKSARRAYSEVVYQRYLPYRIIAAADRADEDIALLKGRNVIDSESGVTGYVCRNYVCQLPASALAEFAEQVNKLQITP